MNLKFGVELLVPIPRSGYFYEVTGKYLQGIFLPIFCSSAEISAQWPEMKNLLEKSFSTSSWISFNLLIFGPQIKYKNEKIMIMNQNLKFLLT